jgi:hypothetical protein
MRAVARAGMPTGAHLMMDNDDKDVDVATASERGLAMRTALGNDRIIGGREGANDRPGVAPGVHEPFRQGGCSSVCALPSNKVAGLPSHAPKRQHLCRAAWIAPEPQSPGLARSWPESETSNKTPLLSPRSRCSTTMTTTRTKTPTTSRASGTGLKGIAEMTQPTRPVTGAERQRPPRCLLRVDWAPPSGPLTMMARVATNRLTMSQQAGGGAAGTTKTRW